MIRHAIVESCCRFGEHRQLAGIITEPADAPARDAFVLVSAGLTPKFGPFRFYAELARRLSSEGHIVLRFDLGGIGDSGQGYGNHPLRKRTELEVRAAVDHLAERRELDGIVLGGLCSGAEDSFRYAALDPRVTGLMLMDPFGFKTLRWRAVDLLVRLGRLTLGMLGRLPPAGDGTALIDYQHMPFAEASRILRLLIRRKVAMHFVYTGGMREHFNHRGQFKEMFKGLDFQGLVALDYFPEFRHTQALEADRRAVIESIASRRRPR
jgi:alpha-beta hydrolase superfamily lysophospholipase